MRQIQLTHLAPRKGLNTFAYETTFRCSSTSRRTGTAKSRSRAVDLRSDRPAGVYETIRHGRDAFIYPHRGSQHWSGSRSSAKHGGFAQQVRCAGPHRYGNRSRSGAGGAGARSDWLCGHGHFITSVYWCYSKKCLTLGFFVWYIWDYRSGDAPVHSRLNPKSGFRERNRRRLHSHCQHRSVPLAV